MIIPSIPTSTLTAALTTYSPTATPFPELTGQYGLTKDGIQTPHPRVRLVAVPARIAQRGSIKRKSIVGWA